MLFLVKAIFPLSPACIVPVWCKFLFIEAFMLSGLKGDLFRLFRAGLHPLLAKGEFMFSVASV